MNKRKEKKEIGKTGSEEKKSNEKNANAGGEKKNFERRERKGIG